VRSWLDVGIPTRLMSHGIDLRGLRNTRAAIRALSYAGLVAVLCVSTACRRDSAADSAAQDAPHSPAARYPIHVRQPATLGVIDTAETTPTGAPKGIACVTCHGTGARAPLVERAGLQGFHDGVTLRHGALSCNSCHAPVDRTRLRLADGEEIAFPEVMRLCGQCHGPQLRDYEHGAHGGMRGYWDLSRGPRERNSCVVCHGAHQPAYPRVIPAPPPRDRFLKPRESSHEVATGGES